MHCSTLPWKRQYLSSLVILDVEHDITNVHSTTRLYFLILILLDDFWMARSKTSFGERGKLRPDPHTVCVAKNALIWFRRIMGVQTEVRIWFVWWCLMCAFLQVKDLQSGMSRHWGLHDERASVSLACPCLVRSQECWKATFNQLLASSMPRTECPEAILLFISGLVLANADMECSPQDWKNLQIIHANAMSCQLNHLHSTGSRPNTVYQSESNLISRAGTGRDEAEAAGSTFMMAYDYIWWHSCTFCTEMYWVSDTRCAGGPEAICKCLLGDSLGCTETGWVSPARPTQTSQMHLMHWEYWDKLIEACEAGHSWTTNDHHSSRLRRVWRPW